MDTKRLRELAGIQEGFKVNIGGGKVPVGHFTWIYIPKNKAELKFISNSAGVRGIKDIKIVDTVGKGKGVEITAMAPEHNSLIKSFQALQLDGEVLDPTDIVK